MLPKPSASRSRRFEAPLRSSMGRAAPPGTGAPIPAGTMKGRQGGRGCSSGLSPGRDCRGGGRHRRRRIRDRAAGGAGEDGGGRRAQGGGRGSGPGARRVPARIADVPVYLNGVGTAKARNTVTVRPQVDGRILSIKFKEGQDVKRGDVLAHDRSRHLPGAARPGPGQEGARRGRSSPTPSATWSATPSSAATSSRRRPSTRSARWSASSPRRSSWTTRPSPTPRPSSTTPPSSRRSTAAPASAWSTKATWCAPPTPASSSSPRSGRSRVLFTLPQQQLAQVNEALAKGAVSGRGARRRRQDRARPRHAAGGRQPGRPDHRHRAHEGGVSRTPTCSSGPASSSTCAC